MGEVIGSVLPLAVAVAVSPVPIIGVILMLLGRHARTTSIGFAFGWVVGIVAATSVFVVVGEVARAGATAIAWIQVVLGVALFGEGVRQWLRRRTSEGVPAWLSAVDGMRPPSAAALGLGLAAVNPKNLLLCIAAGVLVGGAEVPAGSTAAAIAIFAAIASSSVVIPVIAYQIFTESISGLLRHVEKWLENNAAAVLATLILIIGVVLIGNGIAELA
ncbi:MULTISPECIES: GAP family protein [unclassified Gordonia (in: high G+C Gram-positive bacteria)]